MSLLGSLRILENTLEQKDYDSIQDHQEIIRAFLAQATMYY